MSTSPHPEPLRAMLDLIEQLPSQLATGAAIVGQQDCFGGLRRALLCGMGGSSIAAAILGGVHAHELELRVHRGHRLPAGLDESTLLIFSSYSGNTEETLAAYAEAASLAHAARCAIGAGGELADRAGRDGIPYFRLPAGLPPRAALGFGLGALRQLLACQELAPPAEPDIEAAVAVLQAGNAQFGAQAPAGDNRALRLARRLYGRLPLIYATSPLSAAVATRWSNQFNENAKVLAHCAELPELDHNEIMGFGCAGPVREAAYVLLLRDPGADARVLRRIGATREVLGASLRDWDEIEAPGDRAFARALGLVQFGDYLSVYLAGECGVDPVDIAAIDRLKARLAQPN
jgi:glucose/mannose-6-phosphate isomerase